MKILIDTNILISAALFPNSKPYWAYLKAVSYPNQGFVCDQNLDELRRVFNRKFPHKIEAMETFLALALPVLCIITTPIENIEDEQKIRDAADRPIFRAARKAEVDILLTGDRDFLEAGVANPQTMTATDFLDL